MLVVKSEVSGGKIAKFKGDGETRITTELSVAKQNFIPYDIYATNTKLQNLMNLYDPSIRLEIEPEVETDGNYVIHAYDATTRISIPEMIAQGVRDEILPTLGDRFAVLLSSAKSISYQGYCLPNYWLSAVLPHIEIYGYPFKHDYGVLYVDISSKRYYVEIRNQLLMDLMDVLLEMYHRGVVAIDVEGWNLEEYQYATTKNKIRAYGLFAPRWRNTLFAPNPVNFLLDRLAGRQHLKFNVGSNLVTRYFVGELLTKNEIKFSFLEDHVLVVCRSYTESSKISYLVAKGVRKSQDQPMNVVFDAESTRSSVSIPDIVMGSTRLRIDAFLP